MTRAELIAFIMSMKGATETQPFGPEALVYKVMGKMFALVSTRADAVTLKCDPDDAAVFRANYPSDVTPGYYMNKRHWNTVVIGGAVPDEAVRDMVRTSYTLVVAKLKKSDRVVLEQME